MIKDVCLVYVLVEVLGNFGGDIDNFEYLCYMVDFIFVCGYVGKDGKFVDYSEDNVFYELKFFLKVNISGVSLGDGVLVVGYLGCISCYKFVDEVNYLVSWYYLILFNIYNMIFDVIVK